MIYYDFIKIAFGISLSGVSFLGFSLTKLIHHKTEFSKYLTSFSLGISIYILLNLFPVHLLNVELLPAKTFFNILSFVFMIMSLTFHFPLINKNFSDIEFMDYFSVMVRNQREYFTRGNNGSSGNDKKLIYVDFNQLNTDDDVEDSENDADNKITGQICIKKDYCIKYNNLIIILLTTGSVFGVSTGLDIGSRKSIKLTEIIEFHACFIYISCLIGTCITMLHRTHFFVNFLQIIFSISPLFGSILFLSPHYLYEIKYDKYNHAVLESIFYSCLFFLTIVSFLPFISEYYQNQTLQSLDISSLYFILFFLGFIITFTLDNYLYK